MHALPKLHIATSREVGERCKTIAKEMGFELVSMDECDIFVSVLYDQLIPDAYIKKHKCFNFHPGILPWYRGSGAFSWAIINGEIEAGVTLHEIHKDIDNGPVIDIQRFAIWPQDTAESLFIRAEDLILGMFKHWLPKLIVGGYKKHPQIAGRLYLRHQLEKAKDLTKFVRAFTFTGKENAYYYNSKGEKIYLEL